MTWQWWQLFGYLNYFCSSSSKHIMWSLIDNLNRNPWRKLICEKGVFLSCTSWNTLIQNADSFRWLFCLYQPTLSTSIHLAKTDSSCFGPTWISRVIMFYICSLLIYWTFQEMSYISHFCLAELSGCLSGFRIRVNNLRYNISYRVRLLESDVTGSEYYASQSRLIFFFQAYTSLFYVNWKQIYLR